MAEGRGEQLMYYAGEGQQSYFSAAAFLDRWEYNLDIFGAHTSEPAVASIKCPLLVWYGTKESWLADAGVLEFIRKQATSSSRVEAHMIEGADHWYQNAEKTVADIVTAWAASL